MSLFLFLGRTKVSVQARGFVCEYFVTRYILTGRSCQHLAQTPSWRTIPCQLSATAYSVYSQLPSILEAIPPSPTWGCAVLWWQGPTYHGRRRLCWNSAHPCTQLYKGKHYFKECFCSIKFIDTFCCVSLSVSVKQLVRIGAQCRLLCTW